MVKVSVGRMVHYAGDDGTTCHAAVVTCVTSELVGEAALCVLEPGGLSFKRLVREGGLIENTVMYPPGTWHWPERVPE